MPPKTDAESDDDGCAPTPVPNNPSVSRRELLKITGLGALALATTRLPAIAGPAELSENNDVAPADKKLDARRVRALSERGAPTVYAGADLAKIGMPVGGIAAGQLYLGGDGRLWHWDIFNQTITTAEEHYVSPLHPEAPAERAVEQGFAIVLEGKPRRLDHSGFKNVTFCGQYPVGTVKYSDPDVPLGVTMEAFSPFIPLNAEDSSLPATVMRFTVENTSAEAVNATLAGWLQNACVLFNAEEVERRRNRVVRDAAGTRLDFTADLVAPPADGGQPDIVFEDWSKATYEGWTVEGSSFGSGPLDKRSIPAYQGDVGGDGERLVNSHASATGNAIGEKDDATGKLRSRVFRIERNYLTFWLGGGNFPGQEAFNLVVDGAPVRTATGLSNNRMTQRTFNVRNFRGKTAVIEIVDGAKGPWGNIGVGRIVQSNRPGQDHQNANLPDVGDMSLILLGAPAQHAAPRVALATLTGEADAHDATEATAPPEETLIGSLGRAFRLEPGQTTTIDFVLTWRFPNLSLLFFLDVGRHYATRFSSSAAVADYIASNFERLATQTLSWRDTWADSTLPHWFLERTLANASTLATSTTHRFANGRFYGWEGVGSCVGTCTHVWHYEQTMGRLFPEFDINLRERVDYQLGVGFHADGMIGHRGEYEGPAVDGQAGIILRTYRDHQLSPDDAFLKRNWPNVKKAVEWMITQDGNADGVWSGAQHNTLDAEWFGEVAWLTGMYLAGLAAGAQLAQEAGDPDFAARCHEILAAGQKNFVPRMWNGEYFIQTPDPAKAHTVGSYNGCEIDQVLGQSWAFQVGLPRVLPEKETKAALAALWRYNFTPDVGPFRATRPAGRWYAVAGEAGLLMCTWPRGEGMRIQTGFDSYFNECMTGFEHQVAGHMIWEGMVTEGLAIEHAIHDRYHASKRNPWNEVECGDHYARAMASYGVFLAACGYEHHGPKAHLAFAPKLSPEDFRAAFTAAEGWGSYAQRIEKGALYADVALKYGVLHLKTFAVQIPDNFKLKSVKVLLDGEPVEAEMAREGPRVTTTLALKVTIIAGQSLSVSLA